MTNNLPANRESQHQENKDKSCKKIRDEKYDKGFNDGYKQGMKDGLESIDSYLIYKKILRRNND